MKTLFTAEAISKGDMNQANSPVDRIKIGLGIALLASLMGCVGYVDGGYYGGPVVVPGPDVYFWGGDYDRGRDVHVYSQRGYESRAVVHPVVVQPQRGPPQSHPTAAPSAHPAGGGHEGKR